MRRGLIALSAVAMVLTSCGVTHATAGPEKPSGSSCLVTFPGGGGAGRIDPAASRLSCDQSRPIILKYLNMPDDGTYGNVDLRNVDGWTCWSPTAATMERTNVAAECQRATSEIIVRPVLTNS